MRQGQHETMAGGVYNFNLDSEKVRWIKGAVKAHANAMLDRWQMQDALQIGKVKAQEKRAMLIQQARGEHDEQR